MKLVPYGAGLKSELGEKTLSAVKTEEWDNGRLELVLCSLVGKR